MLNPFNLPAFSSAAASNHIQRVCNPLRGRFLNRKLSVLGDKDRVLDNVEYMASMKKGLQCDLASHTQEMRSCFYGALQDNGVIYWNGAFRAKPN